MLKLNRKIIAGAVVAGGLMVAAGAFAGMGHQGKGRGPHGGGFFEHMDANKDGTVTKAEITAFTEARVKEFDGNKDGQITRAEFDAARQAKREEHQQAFFKKLDTNGDGMLSAEEFRNMRAQRGSKGRHDGA